MVVVIILSAKLEQNILLQYNCSYFVYLENELRYLVKSGEKHFFLENPRPFLIIKWSLPHYTKERARCYQNLGTIQYLPLYCPQCPADSLSLIGPLQISM